MGKRCVFLAILHVWPVASGVDCVSRFIIEIRFMPTCFRPTSSLSPPQDSGFALFGLKATILFSSCISPAVP